jgi:hypothetical protein
MGENQALHLVQVRSESAHAGPAQVKFAASLFISEGLADKFIKAPVGQTQNAASPDHGQEPPGPVHREPEQRVAGLGLRSEPVPGIYPHSIWSDQNQPADPVSQQLNELQGNPSAHAEADQADVFVFPLMFQGNLPDDIPENTWGKIRCLFPLRFTVIGKIHGHEGKFVFQLFDQKSV